MTRKLLFKFLLSFHNCILVKNFKFTVILLLMFLPGCGTIAVLDENQSDLMPKSVAISIFDKIGYKEWAEKPYLANIGSFCGREIVYIEFNQILTATYDPRRKALMFGAYEREKSFFCPVLQIRIASVSEQMALELTNAARSLGATKIKKLIWMY